MDMKTKAALLSCTLLLNACATASKSLMLGAAVGGLIGGAMGQNHTHNSEGTTIGLVVGAGLGSLISYFGYKDKVAKASQEARPKIDEEQIPFVTKPKIRSMVVPDSIEGNKFIKSHKIFILEDAGSWSKD